LGDLPTTTPEQRARIREAVENGDRRVTVDDLVALAVVLGVNPNCLLFPVDDDAGDVMMSGVLSYPASLWEWAMGRDLDQGVAEALHGREGVIDQTEWPRMVDDFKRHALPPWEYYFEREEAPRAVAEVARAIRALIGLRRPLGRQVAGLSPKHGDGEAAEQLRWRMTVLSRAVDELIGDLLNEHEDDHHGDR
jgi:hypothetical protein